VSKPEDSNIIRLHTAPHNSHDNGVDCSDIVRIIRWGQPSNMEDYAQESGRAGRNGKPASGSIWRENGQTLLRHHEAVFYQHHIGLKKVYISRFSQIR